jgi:hypothetical protein
MFVQDFILNGQGHGPMATMLQDVRFDPGMLRPYYDKNGDPAVTVNTGRWSVEKGERKPIKEHRRIRDLVNNGIMSPVFNATMMRKEEWLQLDTQVLRAARMRLRAWADLAAANSFGGFNGMSKMILEHETMADPGEAIVDMDGITDGRTDAPKFQLEGLPLPITHSDFWFSARRLAVSRNTGTPLDTTMGEAAGRRVAETIEKTTIGMTTGITYGGNSTQVGGYGRTPSVYGYINFPNRLTKANLTIPNGTNAASTINDVLAMRDQLYLNKFYGPFMLYHSNDWDKYMDNDYILTGGNVATQTLRNRLKAIEGILDVRRLDFFWGTQPSPTAGPGSDSDLASMKTFRLLMVQMTPDVARAVNGLDITTVQWESVGGMRINFKVMCIQVPQLRADFYGNCGILDATNA